MLCGCLFCNRTFRSMHRQNPDYDAGLAKNVDGGSLRIEPAGFAGVAGREDRTLYSDPDNCSCTVATWKSRAVQSRATQIST